jgi:hypothetical protein
MKRRAVGCCAVFSHLLGELAGVDGDAREERRHEEDGGEGTHLGGVMVCDEAEQRKSKKRNTFRRGAERESLALL